MNEGVLFISGEKHPQAKDWEQNYYLAEREFGTFRRCVNLPSGLDEEAARADFEEGILTIPVPRLAEEPPADEDTPVESR